MKRRSAQSPQTFLSSHFPHTVPSVSARKNGKFVREGRKNDPLAHKNSKSVREKRENNPLAHKNGKFVRRR